MGYDKEMVLMNNIEIMDRKDFEDKDISLKWTLFSDIDYEVSIEGYFDYNLIKYYVDDDGNIIISDPGIRFYDDDGLECLNIPKNPFKESFKKELMNCLVYTKKLKRCVCHDEVYEEFEHYNLYEELINCWIYNEESIYINFFDFDGCLLTSAMITLTDLKGRTYTLHIELTRNKDVIIK